MHWKPKRNVTMSAWCNSRSPGCCNDRRSCCRFRAHRRSRISRRTWPRRNSSSARRNGRGSKVWDGHTESCNPVDRKGRSGLTISRRDSDHMTARYSGVDGYVGNTPLIRLRRLSEVTSCELSAPRRQRTEASLLREGNHLVLEGEFVAVRTSLSGSDLRSPSSGDVVERVGNRSCYRERRENERQAVGGIGQGTVLDSEVQVGRVGVPAVTHEGEHLTAADLVAHMDLQSVRLEMAVIREVAVTDVDDHKVPKLLQQIVALGKFGRRLVRSPVL